MFFLSHQRWLLFDISAEIKSNYLKTLRLDSLKLFESFFKVHMKENFNTTFFSVI